MQVEGGSVDEEMLARGCVSEKGSDSIRFRRFAADSGRRDAGYEMRYGTTRCVKKRENWSIKNEKKNEREEKIMKDEYKQSKLMLLGD